MKNKQFMFNNTLPIFCRMASYKKTKECTVPIYYEDEDGIIKLYEYQESDKHFRKRIKRSLNENSRANNK